MFNHFQCNMLMYNENFSKGHKCRENVCPTTLLGLGQNLNTQQSIPIDTMLKAKYHYNSHFSMNETQRESVSLHYEHING